MAKWQINQGGNWPMWAIDCDNMRFIKASGSTVCGGSFKVENGMICTTEWGFTILGKTQVKSNKNETAPPTQRLVEFVLDYVGAVKYGRAVKRAKR